jgi:hypothetical protein
MNRREFSLMIGGAAASASAQPPLPAQQAAINATVSTRSTKLYQRAQPIRLGALRVGVSIRPAGLQAWRDEPPRARWRRAPRRGLLIERVAGVRAFVFARHRLA